MTKIIIDIPEEYYKFIKDLHFYNSGRRSGNTIERNVINGIKNGKPYEESSRGEWGKWIISVIQCPECLECFNFPTRFYSMEVLKECPNCGADMRGVNNG